MTTFAYRSSSELFYDLNILAQDWDIKPSLSLVTDWILEETIY